MNALSGKLIATVSALLVATILTGCVGSSPATRYYALDTTALTTNVSNTTVVSVGPFSIPEYLNRPQIVLRDQGASLTVLNFDRWAEPLADAVNRRLLAQLSQRAPQITWLQFGSPTRLDADYRITGAVNTFEADASGEVTLQFTWAMLDKDNGVTIAPHNVTFSKAVEANNVAAITTAMGELLDELAAAMATEMAQTGVK